MNILKNKLIRSLGIYTLSNIINSAIPFLLLPILTNHLSTSDYGILTNYNSVINILIPLVGVNMMTSLQVIFVKRKEEFASYISSGTVLTIVLTLLFTLLIFVFQDPLARFSGVPKSYLLLTAVYATYNNLIETLLSIWRMEEKAIHYGVFRIGRTIIELSIALILIIGYDWSFDGSIYAIIYSYAIGAIATLFILYKKRLLILDIKKKHINHILQYGVPLIPHVLSSVVIMYSSKLMLTAYHGLSSNGIYSVGFMVGQFIGLLQNSFNQAWGPWVYQQLKSGEHSRKIRIVKLTYIYFISIIVVTLVFWLSSPLIYMFLGKAFESGISLVLWIALGFAFNGMYKMVSVYFFYEEKTKELAVLSVFSAALNIGLNFLWIPKYGFTGAALATMLAMVIQFILAWIWSTKIVKMPWSLSK